MLIEWGSKGTIENPAECLSLSRVDCLDRVYFRKSDKGGELHIQEILGGNMKTHVAV